MHDRISERKPTVKNSQRAWLGVIVAMIATLVLMAAALCLIQAAHADPYTPPTPAPVIGTGGPQTASQPGSSCVSSRLPMKFAPTPTGTDIYSWVGDWVPAPTVAAPVAPTVSCSR